MPTCHICKEKATVYFKDKWWCEHHYQLDRERRENIESLLGKDLQKLPCYGTMR